MNGTDGPDPAVTRRARAIPWRSVLGDLVLVGAWVVVLSFAWGLSGGPGWAYYVVVFGGIVGYSVAAGPWRGRRRG